MKIVSRDLALLPFGLGPIVIGAIGGSSPWTSIMVMEIAVLCSFILDGYFRLREGESKLKALKATGLGLIIGIPLMAFSMLLAIGVVRHLESLFGGS